MPSDLEFPPEDLPPGDIPRWRSWPDTSLRYRVVCRGETEFRAEVRELVDGSVTTNWERIGDFHPTYSAAVAACQKHAEGL